MSTKIGQAAESAATAYLKQQAFTILSRNWRTRWCEIDIIACKDEVIYFVEVKYRQSTKYGSGLEYITNKKLCQMHFAAEFWLSRYAQPHLDYQLAAIEVTGLTYQITAWLDEL